MVWTVLVAAGSAWLGWSIWLEPGTPAWHALQVLPFVVIPGWSVWSMLRGWIENKPERSVRGVRIAIAVVAAGGVVITGLMVWTMVDAGELWATLFLLSMSILMIGFFVLPLLLPLMFIERRLLARASECDPAWHPRLANIRQRHDAVLGFCAAVGAVSGVLVGLQYGLTGTAVFDAESVRQTGAAAMVGLIFGFGIGAMPGTLVAHARNDRDLSRALPPIALWTPIAAVGGTLAGMGWGVAAFAGTMLVVGKVSCIRCRLFEPNRCQSCGYDLTGVLEDGGPCPECGTVAPAIK